jgi:subtilisin-like proprotein convertase family protein
MRRTVLLFLLSGSLLCASASGASFVSAADAPSATPSLLRELNRGAETVAIVVGIKDGTPSPHALLANPDRDGEPERRGIRLAAQRRLADEFTPSRLAVKNYYESFSMLAGTATREAAISLASHPEVAWVDLDREARRFQTIPQASQTLIRSDQVNSAGIRGVRQVVVVIDTGVDYLVQALGGAPFPNQKVIGGNDFGDKDADPQDCDGHGTSIAATIIVVAPDVQIVALKVFSSTNTSNSSCKDTAEFSDIYAALSWCVVHQAELGITVINISLGGEFDDSLPHGFCDADDPGSAAAVDGARAAGMPVFLAAGNDALTNALATPGCVSGAIPIGAVYAESRSLVSWSDDAGRILCTDRGITADTIICFSNSMTTLSLLAPGAFWSVVTRGGGLESFSGTSPATASASGAAALLLQSHPGQSPAWVEAVLTLTGRPIADSRNGVVKSRIDTLAAVQLDPTTFGVASAAAVPIPDGTGSATATAAISGFTHPIAAVQVWAKIAHTEPSQLRLTLIGPDGTSVVLQDRTGQSQYSINSVYGRTDATAQSLGAFSGKQGNGVWTLKVEDLAAGTSGSIRGFAVLLIPLNDRQPISKRTAAASRTPKKVSPRP